MEKSTAKQHKIAYNNKFNAEAYDRINLTVPKGEREKIREHAESRGESVNGYIYRLIAEDMAKTK